MQVRRLSSADSEVYLHLRLAALVESPTSFGSSYEEEKDRTQEQVGDFLSKSAERVLLGAFSGGALVGMVGVGREEGVKEKHRGFIRSMYVSPAYRARDVGKLLLEQAMIVASAWAGLEQLTLSVTGGNERAIGLYARAGFEECGRAPRALLVGGIYYDEIQMVWHKSVA